jgi:hypothetical protein
MLQQKSLGGLPRAVLLGVLLEDCNIRNKSKSNLYRLRPLICLDSVA